MAFNNINPIAIDLFCGAGGLSLGLAQSNITVQLGVEINATAAQTYTNNLNGNVLQNDIRNITGQEILEQLNLRVGELFLLAGCPPCQTFSSLQKDDVTNDERNNLIFEYTRLIHDLRSASVFKAKSLLSLLTIPFEIFSFPPVRSDRNCLLLSIDVQQSLLRRNRNARMLPS